MPRLLSVSIIVHIEIGDAIHHRSHIFCAYIFCLWNGKRRAHLELYMSMIAWYDYRLPVSVNYQNEVSHICLEI